MKRRGASLVNTLMVSTLLAGLAFTTATLTISQLAVNSRLENSKIARDLAESAASKCLAQVMANPDWAGDTEVKLDCAPGGWGRTSFSKSTAGGWSIPPSTNNLSGLTSLTSQADAKRSLPPTSVEVYSVGSYRGATSKVCQVIAIPPYRYAMASTGTIRSSGGLTVASVDDPAVLTNGFDSVLDEQLQAGHLAGNHVGPQSVVLESTPGQPVLIKGGVDSAGGVSLLGGAKVLGSVRQNGQPVPLPSIDVKDYDPRDRSDVVKTELPVQEHFRIEKPTRQKGDLKINSGLELSKGYLYVEGNLDIYGGIKGKGAIFATGDVKIHGVSTYGANDQEAIVAKGDVGIDGTDRNHSIFQGVVYTEGNFNAKDVTLVGSLVGNKARSADGSGGTDMNLYSTNVLYNQKIMQTAWTSGFEVDGGSFSGTALEPLTSDPLTFDTGSSGRGVTIVERPKASNFYDKKIDQFTYEHGKEVPYTAVVVPTTDGGTHEFASWDEAIQTLSTPGHGLPIQYRKIPTLAERLSGMIGGFLGSLGGLFGTPPPPPPPPPPPTLPTWDPGVVELMNQAKNRSYGSLLSDSSTYDALLALKILAFNQYYITSRARWMRLGEFGFSMNPNKFIQMSDKSRRMMWWDE